MNFLGHLYFSENHGQLQNANLFGDFVRGRDLSMYPELIQKGIRYHREIDNYIDHHPVVISLLHELYDELPKIASIAVDLYFDHLLAKNWNKYHSLPYDEYLTRFYNVKLENESFYSTEYLILLAKIKQNNWMHYYQFHEGLDKACKGLSRRISFENELSNGANIFTEKEDLITSAFQAFMVDAQKHFGEYLKKNIPEVL